MQTLLRYRSGHRIQECQRLSTICECPLRRARALHAISSSMVRRFQCAPHTNSDWLNPDTLLDVRALWVIGIFALEDSLSAQGIDEGGTA